MADILPFKAPKRPLDRRKKSASPSTDGSSGSTLCREGHHKWEVVNEQRFDVKAGKLVTRYRCARCGKTRIKAH